MYVQASVPNSNSDISMSVLTQQVDSSSSASALRLGGPGLNLPYHASYPHCDFWWFSSVCTMTTSVKIICIVYLSFFLWYHVVCATDSVVI